MIADARRHARLLLVPVIALTVVLGAVGLLREPTYEAEAQLIVGKVDARIGGVSEFLTSTSNLGKGYARLLYSESVLEAGRRATGLDRDRVRERISATVDTTAPIVHVHAEGDSADQARRLASAVATALVATINRSNTPDPGPQEALAEFRRASAAAEALEDRARGSGAAADAAEVDLRAARLRARAAQTAYEASLSDVPVNLVRVLTEPRGVTDDRRRVLTFLLYVGVVGGLAVGGLLVRRRVRYERPAGPQPMPEGAR